MKEKRILIVDDDSTMLFGMQCILGNIGYRSYLASNGQIALNKYIEHEEEIEMVILDINMPVMNGVEAFYKLKEKNKDVKVIIASSIDDENIIKDLLDNGVKHFLAKPLMQSQLSEAVKMVESKV